MQTGRAARLRGVCAGEAYGRPICRQEIIYQYLFKRLKYYGGDIPDDFHKHMAVLVQSIDGDKTIGRRGSYPLSS